MTLLTTVLDSPVGPLSLVADGDVLVASGFAADPAELVARLSVQLRNRRVEAVSDLGAVSKAHEAYFNGDVAALDDVQVRAGGTSGQQRMWEAMRSVRAGETITYAEMARRAGNAAAVRAAGSACARNLVAPALPCHRIVRSDGGLGGYYYGLDVKRWLLDHEARHTQP